LERLRERWAIEKQEEKIPEPPKKRKRLFQNFPLRKRRKVESSESESEDVEVSEKPNETEIPVFEVKKETSDMEVEEKPLESQIPVTDVMEVPEETQTSSSASDDIIQAESNSSSDNEEETGKASNMASSFLYKGDIQPSWEPKPAVKPSFLSWKKEEDKTAVKEDVKIQEASKAERTPTQEEIADFLGEDSSDSSSEQDDFNPSENDKSTAEIIEEEVEEPALEDKVKPTVKEKPKSTDPKSNQNFSKLNWKSFYNKNWEPHKMEGGLSSLLGFSHVPVDVNSSKKEVSVPKAAEPEKPAPAEDDEESESSDDDLAGSMFMRTEEKTQIQEEFKSKRAQLLKIAKKRGA